MFELAFDGPIYFSAYCSFGSASGDLTAEIGEPPVWTSVSEIINQYADRLQKIYAIVDKYKALLERDKGKLLDVYNTFEAEENNLVNIFQSALGGFGGN